jgi:cytochrome c
MKKILPILLLIISCKDKDVKTVAIAKTTVELSQELFEGKGNCASCHVLDQKIIGPSIQEMATIYRTKNASIINFLKNDAKPIVDPSQYEVMKTNFVITKAMNNNELEAIEAYILSN